MSDDVTTMPVLHIGKKHVFFEPCNNLSDIFYDRLNQKIITVRNDGSLGITVKGFEKKDAFNFCIPSTQKIDTVSFASDMVVGSVHRDAASVDIVFFNEHAKADRMTPVIRKQAVKTKGATIMTVEWVATRQVCLITDYGLELYQVDSKKKVVKFLKTCNVPPIWTVFYPTSQLIICASGIDHGVMNPFVVQNRLIHRLARFEIDFGCSKLRPVLTDRDVMVASIYGTLYLLAVKSDSSGIIRQVNMYQISADVSQSSELSHVLILNLDDCVSLHAVDNLVIVYHRRSAQAYIFDIRLSDNETTDHTAAVVTPISVDSALDANVDPTAFLMLPPNVIVDPRFGIFADVSLNMTNVRHFISDKKKLLRFIMNRTKADELMLEVIQNMIREKALPLSKLSDVFREICKSPPAPSTNTSTISLLQKVDSVKFKLIAESYSPMLVEQSDILRLVFEPLREDASVDKRWLSDVLLEFLLIVKRARGVVDNYIPELLITILCDAQEFNRLQQLLQHRVIEDSRFLAFKLFEMSHIHSPFFQLGIDMLTRRLNYSQVLIQLLQRGQIVDAMRYLPKTADTDVETCLKMLEAAWSTGNRQTKYAVFTHLRDIMKVTCIGDACFAKYHSEFESLFDSEEIEEAEFRFRLARISSSTPLAILSPSEASFNDSFTFSLQD